MNEFDIYIIDKNSMVQKLQKKLRQNSRPKSGAETVFIPITKKIALKGFVTKSEAKAAIRRQQKASKYKLAPKVISPDIFEVIMPVGGTFLASIKGWNRIRNKPPYKQQHRRLFAYKTQIVDKVLGQKISNANKQKIEELEEKMQKYRLSITDLHYGNVGLIGNRMVCIDFGNLSV